MPAGEGVPQDDFQVFEEHDRVDSIVCHAAQPGPESLLRTIKRHTTQLPAARTPK